MMTPAVFSNPWGFERMVLGKNHMMIFAQKQRVFLVASPIPLQSSLRRLQSL